MNSADPLSNWSGIVASGGRLNAYLAALDSGGDIAPTVSLTSPVNGATFSAPATITVAGTASDADGTVSKVDFYANGALDWNRYDKPLQRALDERGGGCLHPDGRRHRQSDVHRHIDVRRDRDHGPVSVRR